MGMLYYNCESWGSKDSYSFRPKNEQARSPGLPARLSSESAGRADWHSGPRESFAAPAVRTI
eukprot:scaffold46851_cov33-Tisochrysis_lutea.AAC.4